MHSGDSQPCPPELFQRGFVQMPFMCLETLCGAEMLGIAHVANCNSEILRDSLRTMRALGQRQNTGGTRKVGFDE